MANITTKAKVDALKALNVVLTGSETGPEINALYKTYVTTPKADAKAAPVNQGTPNTTVAGAENVPADTHVSVPQQDEDDSDHITVRYQDPVKGLTDRVFSREIHGKDFKKIAATFKETHGDKLV